MNCKSCGAKLENVIFFCRRCFMLLPGKERVSLYTMHNLKQNTDAKVAKCVRILKERRTAERHINP